MPAALAGLQLLANPPKAWSMPHYAAPWAISPTQPPRDALVAGPPQRSALTTPRSLCLSAGPEGCKQDAPKPPPQLPDFPHFALPWAIAPTARPSAAFRPAIGVPRTGLRPADPIAPLVPARPDQYSDKLDLDRFENMGTANKLALSVLFGPTPSGRSRQYVQDIYGYMPFGDGYGAAVIGNAPCPPWWWDSSERSPYMTTASWGSNSWLPERPESTCPPDCEPQPFDLQAADLPLLCARRRAVRVLLVSWHGLGYGVGGFP